MRRTCRRYCVDYRSPSDHRKKSALLVGRGQVCSMCMIVGGRLNSVCHVGKSTLALSLLRIVEPSGGDIM